MAPARATPAPAAGACCCSRAAPPRSCSAASGAPPTTEWLPGWKAKGWRTAGKTPVKNVELWQQLDELVQHSGHVIDWRWVRGHNGDAGNERADALANMGVELALGQRKPPV